MTVKEFGSRLKNIRKSKNISRETMAHAIGITSPSYTNYENGFRLPNVLKLPIISSMLGVSVDYLLGISNE